MHSYEKIREVRRLLAEKAGSQRRIAKLAGVSRGTVTAIANEKYSRRERRSPSCEDDPLGKPGPLARCPGCGAMVCMPCRLCYVRALKAIDRRRDRSCHATGNRRPIGCTPSADSLL